ncbi:MAG: guanine deaminase [Pseudomonadota bacterium]|nr:guanine deaminase [Pseudomonadota bacterium]
MVTPGSGPAPGSRVLLGEIVHFSGDPGDDPQSAAIQHWSDGALWIERGRVRACGARADVLGALQSDPAAAATTIDDQRGRLILPGLIDCHLHYAQVGIMASWGRQLLEWLQNYTFPAELACAAADEAERRAAFVLERLLAHGTTTASVFATVHPHSVDAFMRQADRLGLRMLCGKVMMDRNCPPGLRDSVATNRHEIPRLIADWHGRGRLRYTLTPRFVPTSTPQQLELAGEWYAAVPDLHVQSHLCENAAEIDWVRTLHPQAADYFALYQAAGLAGPRTIYGHCLHLTPRERAALRDTGSAVAFCPTSNLFLGSGVLDAVSLLDEGIAVGLATDIGGGSSLSLIRTLAAAYQHSQLVGRPLAPMRAWYLATLGGARALELQAMVGSFQPGCEGDCVVLDWTAIPELDWRVDQAVTLAERMFALAMLGDERCVHATYIEGNRVGALRVHA